MRVRKVFWWSLVLLTAFALVDAYLGSPTSGWGSDSLVTWGPSQTTSGPRVEVSGAVEAAIAPGEVLTLINSRGNVQIAGSDREGLEARYTITVFADDEATAARYAEELQVRAVRRRDGVQLELVQPAETPAGVRGVAVGYQITVPQSVRVQVQNALGRLEVAGVAGPSAVENGFGETVLKNLEGDWKVRTRFAELSAQQVRGHLQLSGTYTVGWVWNVEGPVTGDFIGSLTVEGAESVELDASYTQLRLARISGPIGLSMAFGSAELDGVRHDVQAKGSYGDITVRLDPAAPGFQVDVESRGGEISNYAALLRNHHVVQSRGMSQLKAVVGDGAHVVQVSVRNGHVTVR